MKKLLTLSVIVLLLAQFDVSHALTLELETQEKSLIDRQEITDILNIRVFLEEPNKIPFDYFDVDENGNVAVCRSADNSICIYSRTGDFLYGYSFTCYGDFIASFQEECIEIYFVRGNYIISIDASGNVLKVVDVSDTDNNYSIISDLLKVKHIEIGESIYYLQNDMGVLNWIANDWSQVVIMDRETGSERILYDANQSQIISTVCGLVLFLSLLLIAVFGIVKELKKRSRINYLDKYTISRVDRGEHM